MEHIIAEEVVVYKSKDYKKFVLIKGNRNVFHDHVLRIKKSFARKNIFHLNPAIVVEVGDVLGIIDGQHRIKAAEERDEWIYYVIGQGLELEDVELLNTSSRIWNGLDHMRRFVELGNEDYKILAKLMKETNTGLHNAIAALATNPEETKAFNAPYDAFKQGQFKVYNVENAYEFINEVNFFRQFAHPSAWQRRGFYHAIWLMYWSEAIDFERMKNKFSSGEYVKEIGKYINPWQKVTEYLDDFGKVYNRNLSAGYVEFRALTRKTE